MMEVIGKTNKPWSRLPTKLVINKSNVTSEIDIANAFNKFITNIGPELARKIPTASRLNCYYCNELKEALFFLKTNINSGYDEIGSNVIKNCFNELNDPLKHLKNP